MSHKISDVIHDGDYVYLLATGFGDKLDSRTTSVRLYNI